MTGATDVLLPTSPDEAIAAFGDGSGVTVVAGGTIVMPEINAGRLRPSKAVLLARAGLAAVTREDGKLTVGAMASVQDLVDLVSPLGDCARNVADLEIRSQATVGGNLCAGGAAEVPRGDLQGPLLALDAVVRSAGASGVTTEPLEEFLAHRRNRLVLDVSFDEPAAGAFVPLTRPHTHGYTALAVSAARLASGELRLAVTGAGRGGVRLRSAEAAAGDPAAAGQAALEDVNPVDDAIASAWYRRKVLPVLVERALERLEETT